MRTIGSSYLLLQDDGGESMELVLGGGGSDCGGRGRPPQDHQDR